MPSKTPSSRPPVFAAALAAALLIVQHAGAVDSGLGEGQLFPDLRLPDLKDGEHVTVSSFRGKKLLLLVYASW